MMFFSIVIFSFCLWAVFSHKFDDGILVKHLLSLAAIISMLVILDPVNKDAFLAALGLFITGIACWVGRVLRELRHFNL